MELKVFVLGKTMKNILEEKKKCVLFTMLLSGLFVSLQLRAQQFNVQGDLVSSYIWRGMYQTGVSIQPTLGFQAGGFSLTAWGSTDFDGTSSSAGAAAKEIDLTAAYTFGKTGLTLSVADLWWAGQGAKKYFCFKNNQTAHHIEAGLAYTLPVEKFPLSVAWNTMVYGMDKNNEGKQNFSSYMELNYPFNLKKVALNATCGMVPYAAPNQYGNNGFAVTNVALKGTVNIQVSPTFTLPIFTQVVWNPCLEDTHVVFGITLRP